MTAAVAVLFSLIAPGAGHALTGNYVQACVLGGLFALGKTALLPLSLRFFHVQNAKRTLQVFYVWNWLYIVLIFYAIISAFWCGLYAEKMNLFSAVVFAFAIILLQKNTKNKFIFTALCGREGVWELMQQMRKSPTEKRK